MKHTGQRGTGTLWSTQRMSSRPLPPRPPPARPPASQETTLTRHCRPLTRRGYPSVFDQELLWRGGCPAAEWKPRWYSGEHPSNCRNPFRPADRDQLGGWEVGWPRQSLSWRGQTGKPVLPCKQVVPARFRTVVCQAATASFPALAWRVVYRTEKPGRPAGRPPRWPDHWSRSTAPLPVAFHCSDLRQTRKMVMQEKRIIRQKTATITDIRWR